MGVLVTVENDNERCLRPEEPVLDRDNVVVGYIRPYSPGKYAAEHKAHWAWRDSFASKWNICVLNPTRRIRHKELAQAVVIASRYGGY